jgi:redox-sensitive bicupin YhaK (pirin superfamily)
MQMHRRCASRWRLRSPRPARRLHGLQLWVALPREHEESAPSVKVKATIDSGVAPSASNPATRRAILSVLPEPAQAMT